ncbi:uncharacterized protein LOC133135522 isoform X1 [Conger conger]|uniref:uncharacterized protein LOC133135522 isoform X1 n=1 Tax=Conger conger TaxID=82655 RepID=UPI002A599385|nr:uncharacterized protein LOC133135522 isoform X1 [Conger conger]XP_061108566.1 uncharacterized protein LOC133135522 isoform X1 [Conger conger]
MKSKRTAYIGIYSDTSFKTRSCAVQYKNKEMESRSVCESPQVKSPASEISTELICASENQTEDWQVAPTPLRYAPRTPLKRRLLLLSVFGGIITLACLVTVFYLYLFERAAILSEVKDLRAYLDSWQEPVKVAFSASLRKGENFTLGPYPQFHILVFKNVLTNVGRAYNVSTGIFTVPVRGVYRFYFTAFGWGERTPCGILLHLNEDYLMGNYDNNPGPGRGATNMITLELDVGQLIYMGLSKGRRLQVSPGNYNLFSGRLLFTL